MIIHTESQYQRSLATVRESRKVLEEKKKQLVAKGLTPQQIKRVLDPTRSFLQDIEWEVKWYERAKRGEILPDENLESLGRTLIALRIACGMTQTELAKRLDITQAQVSQDESDEYHAISVERAQKILSVFGAHLAGRVFIDCR